MFGSTREDTHVNPPPSPTNYETTTAPCMSTNKIKIKTCSIVLTSELIRRFLVNNILMFASASCLIKAQIQFSLIKKNVWTFRTLATPTHPLHPITYHFCLTNPISLKVYIICVSPLS